MSRQCIFLAALAGSTIACSEPSYGSKQKAEPDAGPSATSQTVDAAVPSNEPGRVAEPSTSGFVVLSGRTVSGTLALSGSSISHSAAVCTDTLCATGGISP